MKIKYAILIFRASYKLPTEANPFYFNDKTFIKAGKVQDYFSPDADIEHWKEWTGSTRWEDVAEGDDLILTWDSTEQHDVLDKENHRLLGINYEYLRCLPIATSYCFTHSQQVFAITGHGIKNGEQLLINDIRSIDTYQPFNRSLFLDPAMKHEDPFFKKDIFKEWKYIHDKIQTEVFEGKSRQLLEALRSFEEAFRSSQLEFKIPNLVRSIECIIDCYGAKDFSKKLLWYVGEPADEDAFCIRKDIESLLQDVYQLRNDCSHGKEFGWSISKKLAREITKEDVAKYEFVTEWAARNVFHKALDGTLSSCFKDRESLVDLWKDYVSKIPKHD